MEVVYEERLRGQDGSRQFVTVDQRIKLNSVAEVMVNDRLHRNGMPIMEIKREADGTIVVGTLAGESVIKTDEPVYVWRVKFYNESV